MAVCFTCDKLLVVDAPLVSAVVVSAVSEMLPLFPSESSLIIQKSLHGHIVFVVAYNFSHAKDVEFVSLVGGHDLVGIDGFQDLVSLLRHARVVQRTHVCICKLKTLVCHGRLQQQLVALRLGQLSDTVEVVYHRSTRSL